MGERWAYSYYSVGSKYIYIHNLDYVLQASIELMKENGFTLKKARSIWYLKKTITDTDYKDDITLLANKPTQVEFLLHSLEYTAGGIGLHVNADKRRYMCFNQGDISTLNGCSLKLVGKFTYLGSSISSTESDINMCLAKAWTAINRLLIIWKSDLYDKIKHNFFEAAVVSILLYVFVIWTLTNNIEKKLDKNTMSYIKEILEATFLETATVQPSSSYL